MPFVFKEDPEPEGTLEFESAKANGLWFTPLVCETAL
jgi:hypothetical protein